MSIVKKLIYFLYLPILLVIRVISKFYLIRFSEIESSRIGHFACCTEIYLCEKDHKMNTPKIRYLDLFILGNQICNKQIEIHLRRKLIILPRIILVPLINLNKIIPGGEKHNCFLKKNLEENKNFFDHRDTYNLLDISKKHFYFEDSEITQAINLCEKIGINLKKKIVTINLRDNFYFDNNHPKNKFDYYHVKNCDIDDYLLAIKDLIKLDYQVIRIGKGSNKKLNLDDKNYFDLTSHSLRTDLLELFLIEKSSFVIGCNSGGTYAALFLFRKPTYISNFLPFSGAYTNSNKILINFKSIVSKSSNKELTMKEIFNEGLFSYEFTQDYEKKGLKFVDLDPRIIQTSVRELMLRSEKKWDTTEYEKELENKFIKVYKEFLKRESKIFYHGKIKCNFGFDYLKANNELIL